MNYAFLSDIHGNIYALDAALEHAYRLNINKFICLGDYVGYYYWPDKCLDKLRDINAIMIKGNHEDILGSIIQNRKDKKIFQKKYGNGHNIAIEKMSESEINFLLNLEQTKLLNLSHNLTIKICHGSPNSIDEYLYPDTDENLLDSFLEEDNLIACGHTHYQMKYVNFEKKMIFNPGSIGQPRSKGVNGACWASLCSETKILQFHQTPYDKTEIFKNIEIHDPSNNYLKEVLS